MYVCSVISVVSDSATERTVVCQDPLPMRFSKQEYWSGLSQPPLGDLADPGIHPTSLMSPALAGRFFTTNATWEAPLNPQMTLNDTKSSDDPKVFMQVKVTTDSLKEQNFSAAVVSHDCQFGV